MIEYILITALASFINIYTVTAVTEPNFQLKEPKIGYVTVSDAGNNKAKESIF